MAFVRRDDWQARGGLIMQPKTGQDQSEKRPGAGTEPSTALDPKKVTESPRDKNKDSYTLETMRRIGEDKTPDDVDSFARGRLTRGAPRIQPGVPAWYESPLQSGWFARPGFRWSEWRDRQSMASVWTSRF